MDGTKPKVIGEIREKKTDWTERITNNVEMSINEEKEMIILRYEEVLNFLKGVTINNEQDLVHIKKPLDDLMSNLKYIPNGPLFNDVIPTEIKDRILNLNYPCDSNAFVAASVCHEWKGVLETRFRNKKVIIGEDCSKCVDTRCVKPEDMLKAAADHKLDVHLVISEPVTEVNPKLVTDALTSVSKFTLVSDDYDDDIDFFVPILSIDQFEHLLESIEKGDKVMEEVKLINLDLDDLNQERLANVLVNKIEKLTLGDVSLNSETFISKLQQNASTFKLTHLTTGDVTFCPNFDGLINAEELKTVFNRMAAFQSIGYFNLEQLEAIRSLPDVQVTANFQSYSVKKGLNGM